MDFDTTLRRLMRTLPAQCPTPLAATVFLMGTPGRWNKGQWSPQALASLGREEHAVSPEALAQQLLAGQTSSQAPFLEFPSDIQVDWARALVNFQEWLMAQLHATHGLPSDPESVWPRAARRLCQNLGLAHASLQDLADPHDIVSAEERLAPVLRLTP